MAEAVLSHVWLGFALKKYAQHFQLENVNNKHMNQRQILIH